jgi:hypothetical protein
MLTPPWSGVTSSAYCSGRRLTTDRRRGGLGLAAKAVFGARPVWFADKGPMAGHLEGLQAPADAAAVLALTPDACCVELRGVRDAKGRDAGPGEARVCDASPAS